MLNLTVNVEGKTSGDLELALQEIVRLVSEGYLSGGDGNDTGDYHFDILGEEEECEDE